jgi:hypothetical protein
VWTDCDSEWLIGINGGFCVEKEILVFMAAWVSTDWVHENLNRYVSLYPQLAIVTEL